MRRGLRTLSFFLWTALFTASACAFQDDPGAESAGDGSFEVVTIAGGLSHPWAMEFLPGGDMLVTERPGRLRIIRNGSLLDASVEGVPEVHARGQGGLLDVIRHPDFEENDLIYLSYSKPVDGGSTTAVIRGRFENDRLLDVEEVFEAVSSGRGHYGCRLAFDADGYLFITIGDRQASPTGDVYAHPAQDLSNHHGTIVRLHDDGRVPDDNPFVNDSEALPSIWSYGHRNPQGMAIHPETGDLWINEHGPQGGDELNLVLPGRNYGWPVVGYGVNYGGGEIHEGTEMEGMEQPVHYWVPSIATSGLMIYSGEPFSEWNGDMFVGGLAGRHIAHLEMNGSTVTNESRMLDGMARVRAIKQGPDGLVYVAFDTEGASNSVVRLEPSTADQ